MTKRLPSNAKARPDEARPKLAGRTILLMEDEYFLAEDLAAALRAEGAEIVGPIDDVDVALRHLAGGPVIDGAILDVNLHEQMIYPVADALQDKAVPFVFTTGYEKQSLPEAYQNVSIWQKPLDVKGVISYLATRLREPRDVADPA